MTNEEIIAKVAQYEKGLNNPNVPESAKKTMITKIAELKSQLAETEKKEVKVQKEEVEAQEDLSAVITKLEKGLSNPNIPDSAKATVKKRLEEAKAKLAASKKELSEDKKEAVEEIKEVKEAVKEVEKLAKVRKTRTPKEQKVPKIKIPKVEEKKREEKSKKRKEKLKDTMTDLEKMISKHKELKARYSGAIEKFGAKVLENDSKRAAKPFGYRFRGKNDYRDPKKVLSEDQFKRAKKRGILDYEGRSDRADKFPNGVGQPVPTKKGRATHLGAQLEHGGNVDFVERYKITFLNGSKVMDTHYLETVDDDGVVGAERYAEHILKATKNGVSAIEEYPKMTYTIEKVLLRKKKHEDGGMMAHGGQMEDGGMMAHGGDVDFVERYKITFLNGSKVIDTHYAAASSMVGVERYAERVLESTRKNGVSLIQQYPEITYTIEKVLVSVKDYMTTNKIPTSDYKIRQEKGKITGIDRYIVYNNVNDKELMKFYSEYEAKEFIKELLAKDKSRITKNTDEYTRLNKERMERERADDEKGKGYIKLAKERRDARARDNDYATEYANGGMMARGGNVVGEAGSKYKIEMWDSFEAMQKSGVASYDPHGISTRKGNLKSAKIVYSNSEAEIRRMADDNQEKDGASKLYEKRRGKYNNIATYLEHGGMMEDGGMMARGGKVGRKKYTYIPQDEIESISTWNGVSFEHDDILDGGYVRGSNKKYAGGGLLGRYDREQKMYSYFDTDRNEEEKDFKVKFYIYDESFELGHKSEDFYVTAKNKTEAAKIAEEELLELFDRRGLNFDYDLIYVIGLVPTGEYARGGKVDLRDDAQRFAKPSGWRWKEYAVTDGIVTKNQLAKSPTEDQREEYPEYVYYETRKDKSDKKPSYKYKSI